MSFGFSLVDYPLSLARQNVYYYETFNIVVFASLVLAARSLPRVKKVKALAAGLGFLFVTHLAHRIANALLVCFNFTPIAPVDLTLLVVGQYLLPVLFLAHLVRLHTRVGRRFRQLS
jgi:hypothetical protein